VATVIMLYILQLVFGSLRVSEEEEFVGLDLSQHSESAYVLGSAE
jgi:ammonia channel protein AmtB